jgi:hypothetical protein
MLENDAGGRGGHDKTKLQWSVLTFMLSVGAMSDSARYFMCTALIPPFKYRKK